MLRRRAVVSSCLFALNPPADLVGQLIDVSQLTEYLDALIPFDDRRLYAL